MALIHANIAALNGYEYQLNSLKVVGFCHQQIKLFVQYIFNIYSISLIKNQS